MEGNERFFVPGGAPPIPAQHPVAPRPTHLHKTAQRPRLACRGPLANLRANTHARTSAPQERYRQRPAASRFVVFLAVN